LIFSPDLTVDPDDWEPPFVERSTFRGELALGAERSTVRGELAFGEEVVPRTEGLTRAAESPDLEADDRAPESWREGEEAELPG
jgi:hypothetical protein